jgi:hypothetical protein
MSVLFLDSTWINPGKSVQRSTIERVAAHHLLDTGKSFVDLQHLRNRNPSLRAKFVVTETAEARTNGASVRG